MYAPDLEPLRRLLLDSSLLRDGLLTLIFLVAVVGGRAALLRAVRRTAWATPEHLVRWRSQIRAGFLALTVIGLVVIWGAELRTLAVSLVAVAVALVIATKELILCLLGAVLRASAAAFTVGDRVQLRGIRGDVLDTGILATSLREVDAGDQHTGKVVSFPNSVFLSEQVLNETRDPTPVSFTLLVPLAADADWRAEERILQRAAAAAEARAGVQVTPVVDVRLQADARVELIVRLAAPQGARGRLEQDVLRTYLDLREEGAARASA